MQSLQPESTAQVTCSFNDDSVTLTRGSLSGEHVAMPPHVAIDPRLFHDLSVYQDVRVDGQTLYKGERDCAARWDAIVPHLGTGGVLLDIGSNFGYFGLRWRERFPTGAVASVEADVRSAAVQRAVLDANGADCVKLVTAKACAGMMRRFESRGQRFDAVLLFSILHWIGDHREMLTALGRIAGRMFIEQPDPRECGAGVERLRSEIGPIGPYLGRVFPDRSIVHLASWPSHRNTVHPRELWMVCEPAGWEPTDGVLQPAALVNLESPWTRWKRAIVRRVRSFGR